jgi:hypothetical protein
VDIGFNLNFSLPLQWAPVPGLPVYYATNAPANIFQYYGQYYAYDGTVWYVAPTYNGPWMVVAPEFVPAILLRVPVVYYRVPPPHLRVGTRGRRPAGGSSTAPPGPITGLPGAAPSCCIGTRSSARLHGRLTDDRERGGARRCRGQRSFRGR